MWWKPFAHRLSGQPHWSPYHLPSVLLCIRAHSARVKPASLIAAVAVVFSAVMALLLSRLERRSVRVPVRFGLGLVRVAVAVLLREPELEHALAALADAVRLDGYPVAFLAESAPVLAPAAVRGLAPLAPPERVRRLARGRPHLDGVPFLERLADLPGQVGDARRGRLVAAVWPEQARGRLDRAHVVRTSALQGCRIGGVHLHLLLRRLGHRERLGVGGLELPPLRVRLAAVVVDVVEQLLQREPPRVIEERPHAVLEGRTPVPPVTLAELLQDHRVGSAVHVE